MGGGVHARLDVPSGIFLAVADGGGCAWVMDTNTTLHVLHADLEAGMVYVAKVTGERESWSWEIGSEPPPVAVDLMLQAASEGELRVWGILPRLSP